MPLPLGCAECCWVKTSDSAQGLSSIASGGLPQVMYCRSFSIWTFNFTMSFSKSNLVPPWFLQWWTFILKQPSRKFRKRSNRTASVLRIKVHFDIQKLMRKLDIAFVRFASRLRRLHSCIFDWCGFGQPSHEFWTLSLVNVCLALVFYRLVFLNC